MNSIDYNSKILLNFLRTYVANYGGLELWCVVNPTVTSNFRIHLSARGLTLFDICPGVIVALALIGGIIVVPRDRIV